MNFCTFFHCLFFLSQPIYNEGSQCPKNRRNNGAELGMQGSLLKRKFVWLSWKKTSRSSSLIIVTLDHNNRFLQNNFLNSPKIAAILGEFGVYQRIQSPIFLKPNMQFKQFFCKAPNYGPM
jgi:hypothetical protein